MAPHWKCGSGKPIAGSNPALSATPTLRAPMSRSPARPALAPEVAVTVLAGAVAPGPGRRAAFRLHCADVHRAMQAEWSPLSCGESGSRIEPSGTRSGRRRIRDPASGWRSCCSTPGSGSATTSSDAYYRIQARRVPDALAEAGLAVDDVTTVINCHLHARSFGPERSLPGHPIYVQRRVGDRAHDRPHDPRVDRLPRCGLSAGGR